MTQLLDAQNTADLTKLLGALSRQYRLARVYRDEASYWATQVRPDLDGDDAETIAWLLGEVAAGHLIAEPVRERAKAWASRLERLVSATTDAGS
jgi:hypothetical protein